MKRSRDDLFNDSCPSLRRQVSAPYHVVVSSSPFTIGRSKECSLSLISLEAPLTVSRHHATLKHICYLSPPLCPLHDSQCMNEPPLQTEKCSKNEDLASSTQVNHNPSLMCQLGHLLLHDLKENQKSCQWTTVCGGGWILVDGEGDGTHPSLNGVRVNGSLLNKAIIKTHAVPAYTWLAHEDVFQCGVLHSLSYIFLRPPHHDCLNALPKKKSSTSLSRPLEPQPHCPFLCTICVDWLLHPVALVCGHTFCSKCILRWFQNLQFRCPICRKLTEFPMTRILAIDSMIDKQLPEKDRPFYNARLREAQAIQDQDKKDVLFLQNQVKDYLAASKSYVTPQYLNILVAWSKNQRDQFSVQFQKYSGAARVYFAALVGFTPELVKTCEDQRISLMAKNLNIKTYPSM